MKRLLLLLLLVVAAWYGWKHRDEILHRGGTHEAVVENATGREMTRVRLSVGGQDFVKESIPDEGRASFPFHGTGDDQTFRLTWSHGEGTGDRTWTGGLVSRGPLLQRHVMKVDGEDAVIYEATAK